MTLDEARRVLEVSAGATSSEVRKAYTRLVKQHTPERDPQGFQRVRAAYELLKRSGTDLGLTAVIPAAPIDEIDAPPESTPVSLPPIDDARAALFASLRGATIEEEVKLLRAFLATRPDDDDVRHMLVDALDTDEAAVRAMLLEGIAHGQRPTEFAEELLVRDPKAGDARAIDALRGEPRLAPVLAVALAARGDDDEAAEIARAAIATDASGRGDRRATWILAAARAFAIGDVELGRVILEAVDRSLPDDVKRARGPRDAIVDLLVHELGLHAEQIDDPIFLAIAQAIWDPRRDPLGGLRSDDPIAARRMYERLAKRSPTLAKFAADAVLGETHVDPDTLPMQKRPASFAWVIIAIAMGALRMAASMTSSHHVPPSVQPWLQHAHPSPTTAAPIPEEDVICTVPGNAIACTTAHEASVALERHDCTALFESARELETLEAQGRLRSSRAQNAAHVLVARIASECALFTDVDAGSP